MATAKALKNHSPGDCFEYVTSSPNRFLSKYPRAQTETAKECQSLCRKTKGCKAFQWMPIVWNSSGDCNLHPEKQKWSRYEWYMLPNAVSGPPTCTSNNLIFT